MSTEMTTVDFNQLPSTQLGSDEQFSELSRSAGFLGRLQLYSKGAPIDEGLIPPGHYGIPESEKKIIDLGTQIDVLPLARRTKALDMSEQSPIALYDASSEDFKDIAARSQDSDSKCMYGTSFLVFERSNGRLLEFFFGSKSSRPIAGDMAVFLPLTQADIDRKKAAGADVSKMEAHGPLPCTLYVIKSKRGFSWHVAEVQANSVPFTNLPAISVIADKINKTIFCIGVLMTRFIQLTQGKQAIVSDENYDLLVSAGPWYAMKRRASYYACNSKHGLMHRFLWQTWHGTAPPMVDHKNRNGLNNCRDNLREASRSENAFNSDIQGNNRSGLRGVCWRPDRGKWWVRIYKNRRAIHVGYFTSKQAAGEAYNDAARRIAGDFAVLNCV